MTTLTFMAVATLLVLLASVAVLIRNVRTRCKLERRMENAADTLNTHMTELRDKLRGIQDKVDQISEDD